MTKYCARERYLYLQELVTEFQDSNSEAQILQRIEGNKDYNKAKKQVLANLGNFAYDPVNYDHFRNLNVIPLFLDQLDEDDDDLVEFAVGGLCNLSLDKTNKQYILKKNGIKKLVKCLSSSREETVLSAVTTLMFLITPESKSEITTLPIIDCMLRFKNSSNRRLSNLASVFLEEYCTQEQIAAAQKAAAAYASAASP